MSGIDWREAIGDSFGDGPENVGADDAALVAGRRALRRRRLSGALGVVATVAVLAVAVPLAAPDGDGPATAGESGSQVFTPTAALSALRPADRASELELQVGDLQRLKVDRQTGELTLPDSMTLADRSTVPGTESPTYELTLGADHSLYLAVQKNGTVVAKRGASGELATFGQEVADRVREPRMATAESLDGKGAGDPGQNKRRKSTEGTLNSDGDR